MTVKVASYVSRCKRSRNPRRTPIVRSVPPIVSEAVWEQAQATLQHNLRFGLRHCRRLYLLRGLVKCGRCGLTYIGMTVRGRNPSCRQQGVAAYRVSRLRRAATSAGAGGAAMRAPTSVPRCGSRPAHHWSSSWRACTRSAGAVAGQ